LNTISYSNAITEVSVNAGFTDTTALEEPFSIAAGTYTSVATDAAVFVFDHGATTKEWHMCAVDTGTDDTGCAATGTAPTADVFQTLRLEVSNTGTCQFFIDGALEGTLNDTGVAAAVNLFATITVNATAATAKDLDVDFIYCGVSRG